MKINVIEKVDGEYKVITRDMTAEEEAKYIAEVEANNIDEGKNENTDK